MTPLVQEIVGVYSIQLYDPAQCDSIIKFAESRHEWSDAEIGEEDTGIVKATVRREYRAAQTFSPADSSLVRRDFDAKVNGLIKPFTEKTWRIKLKEHSGSHIVKYSPGGFYVTHADAALDLTDRYFTVLCYLNDDFDGGQTSFPSLGFSIVPKKGRAVIFPATYPHRGEAVFRGHKYVFVTWLMGDAPIQFI